MSTSTHADILVCLRAALAGVAEGPSDAPPPGVRLTVVSDSEAFTREAGAFRQGPDRESVLNLESPAARELGAHAVVFRSGTTLFACVRLETDEP